MSKSTNSINDKIKYKIVFLGDQGVGKSCLIQRFINNKFQEKSNPTVGIDFLSKNFSYNNQYYRLQLWDTAGQQRFRSLIPGYLKDAVCAIIVFDIINTDNESFQNLRKWIELYNENKLNNGIAVICANKIDLISKTQNNNNIRKYAQENKMAYFEVSAKTGANITQMFENILELLSNPQQTPRENNKIQTHQHPKQFQEPSFSRYKQVNAIKLNTQEVQITQPKSKKCCGK